MIELSETCCDRFERHFKIKLLIVIAILKTISGKIEAGVYTVDIKSLHITVNMPRF